MAKVTVLDIISTRKTLARLENYARRHMDNLPIAEANDSVREARDMLMNNVEEFENCDVTLLTADTTDLEKRIDYVNSEIEFYQNELAEEMAKKKKNRSKWYVKNCRANLDRYTDEIADLEFRLDA